MSCLTKLYLHTGTTDPTDIGPASGGVLHSLVVISNTGNDPIIVRDGGSSGVVILNGNESIMLQIGQLLWKGAKLDGQLNIELPNAASKVVVEMSEI